MFVFRKIWHALFSCYLRFEINPFALLPTHYSFLKKPHTFYIEVIGEKLIHESFESSITPAQENLPEGQSHFSIT